MVTPLRNILPKLRTAQAARRFLAAALSCILLTMTLQLAEGQNLTNNGQITNNGKIRVKGIVTGLPVTIDGKVEYFGANQNVQAAQYRDLILTGSGTKASVGGSFSVSGDLTIAAPVTLNVQLGQSITLIGNLIEQGYFQGSIGKTANLSGPTTSSNFGNIGATISWIGTAPGTTTATRTSGIASTGNGNQSVKRYYDIAPTFGLSLNGSFTYRYTANELNALDSSALELWRSTNGGVDWRRQGGTNLPGFSAIVKTGIVSFSRWTASDTSNLLGPTAYEWVASNLASTSGDGQSAAGGTALAAPFIVTVTDFYVNPIPGASVNFVVDSIPSGAAGYSLSATNVTTDASGQAATVLTLGNTSGPYRVRAYSGSLTGSPRTFVATATTAASSMTFQSGNNQVDTIKATLAPFSVIAEDASGNSVAGVLVNFSITNRPAGEAGTAISASSATTNGLGIASTVLRFGDKVGTYEVTATSTALPAIQLVFSSTATNGVANALGAFAGNNQSDTIFNVLDTAFVVRITDAGANAVPNVAVQFAIASAPTGAIGQTLNVTSSTTNASGEASTRLTLGSKIGSYQVTATSASLTGSPFTFAAQAIRGAPAILAAQSGSGQQKPVATTLDTAFVIRVADIGGNPVQDVPVQFTLTGAPTGATGQGLTATFDTTDINGEASTVLMLGSKTGVYAVAASSSVLPSVSATFNARATASAAAQVLLTSGDGQGRPAGALLLQPFIVTVNDVFGNPVAGVTVQFAVTGTPSGASGYQLTPASATTDTLGLAQSTLRLGNYPGTYITTATVTSLPTVQFTSSATYIVADVNNDFDVNIADLTSIIDHILGRRILTGIDSVKADVNNDGAINILDALEVRNALLGTSTLVKAGSQDQTSSSVGGQVASLAAAANITGELEFTPVGLRFNLTNDVPVKGVQLFVALRSAASVSSVDLVFKRAKQMEFFFNTQGTDVKMLAFNFQNLSIDPGSGSLVRLQLKLADTTDVDSVYAIVSVADTTFDVAVRISVTKKQTVYPTTFRLYQNYPNPFNPSTTIEFEVPEVSGRIPRVAIQIFNMLGQKVLTIDRGEKDAGRYRVVWDGRDEMGSRVPSGVYFYRLLSPDFATSKKMVLVK